MFNTAHLKHTNRWSFVWLNRWTCPDIFCRTFLFQTTSFTSKLHLCTNIFSEAAITVPEGKINHYNGNVRCFFLDFYLSTTTRHQQTSLFRDILNKRLFLWKTFSSLSCTKQQKDKRAACLFPVKMLPPPACCLVWAIRAQPAASLIVTESQEYLKSKSTHLEIQTCKCCWFRKVWNGDLGISNPLTNDFKLFPGNVDVINASVDRGPVGSGRQGK